MMDSACRTTCRSNGLGSGCRSYRVARIGKRADVEIPKNAKCCSRLDDGTLNGSSWIAEVLVDQPPGPVPCCPASERTEPFRAGNTCRIGRKSRRVHETRRLTTGRFDHGPKAGRTRRRSPMLMSCRATTRVLPPIGRLLRRWNTGQGCTPDPILRARSVPNRLAPSPSVQPGSKRQYIAIRKRPGKASTTAQGRNSSR